MFIILSIYLINRGSILYKEILTSTFWREQALRIFMNKNPNQQLRSF